MVRRQTADLAHLRLSFAEIGSTGPAIVLIHGLADSLDAYLPVANELRSDAHLYAVDLRGHGDSSPVPGFYRILDYAMDIAEFLGTIVGEPALLVGCSLGALIASCVAAHADVFGALLEDPPFYVGQMPTLKETPFFEFYKLLAGLLPAHHGAGGTVADLHPQALNPWVGEELQRTIAWNLHRLDPMTVEPAIRGALFDGFDPDETLPRITCPIHIIVARGDPFAPAFRDEDQKKAKALIPDASCVAWQDTIHAIHHQRPVETANEIRAFVERIRHANRA